MPPRTKEILSLRMMTDSIWGFNLLVPLDGYETNKVGYNPAQPILGFPFRDPKISSIAIRYTKKQEQGSSMLLAS